MTANRMQLSDRHWGLGLIAIWVMVLVAAYGPATERNLFPVVSKFEILQIEPDGAGSRVYVRFEKYRSCEYLGITWSRVMPDGTLRRAFLNLKPADDMTGSTRPVGAQVAGPWYVGMTPEQVKDQSRVTLAYRCHPLWITEKEAWP
jgi:hypothetical protein